MIDRFDGTEYRWLSNFYLCEITYKDHVFRSTEHAYQWAKTNDPLEKESILLHKDKFGNIKPSSPGQAKNAGRLVTLREKWDEGLKESVMLEVVTCKIDQHADLAQKLINTFPHELIEGNTWCDNFFGVCVCPKCKGLKGLNKLGLILTINRERLMNG